jgi:hypothetical protein
MVGSLDVSFIPTHPGNVRTAVAMAMLAYRFILANEPKVEPRPLTGPVERTARGRTAVTVERKAGRF